MRWALQNKNRCPLRGPHDNRSPARPYSPSNPLRLSVNPGGQIDSRSWAQSKHGLRPLQHTHQALESIDIKIRMHFDPARPPASTMPAHNSIRAAPAISWLPTPPAPTGRPKKLFCSFSSSVASSGDDQACRSSNPDSGKTRCAAYRCSQTQPPTAEPPLVYVAWALTTRFLPPSRHFNIDPTCRTGVLIRRLQNCLSYAMPS